MAHIPQGTTASLELELFDPALADRVCDTLQKLLPLYEYFIALE